MALSFSSFLLFPLSLSLYFSLSLSCIMIIQLLHIEHQRKVISGSIYLEEKVTNDKTITIELESVSWFILVFWTLDSHWLIMMKDETGQPGIPRFILMGIKRATIINKNYNNYYKNYCSHSSSRWTSCALMICWIVHVY